MAATWGHLPTPVCAAILGALDFRDLIMLMTTCQECRALVEQHLHEEAIQLDLTACGKQVNAALKSAGRLCHRVTHLAVHDATHVRQACHSAPQGTGTATASAAISSGPTGTPSGPINPGRGAAAVAAAGAGLVSCFGPHLTSLQLMSLTRHGLTPGLATCLASSCSSLRELDLTACSADVSQQDGAAWGQLPPSLTRVVLRDVVGLSGAAVRALAALPGLEEVDVGVSVANVAVRGEHLVGDEDVAALVVACGPRLRRLSVSLRSCIRHATAAALRAHTPNLTHLDCSVTSISPEELVSIAQRCLLLEELRCAARVPVSLDDEQVAALMVACGGPDIPSPAAAPVTAAGQENGWQEHQLLPQHADGIATDRGTRFRPLLRVLDLSQHGGFGDIGLGAVAAACPSLQEFKVSRNGRVSAEGLATVMASCPQLLHCTVVRCRHVGQGSLRKLQKRFAGTTRCELSDGLGKVWPPLGAPG